MSDKVLALPGCGPALSSNLYQKRRSFPLENLKQKSSIVVMQVQQLLLEGPWSDKVLALPGCGPALISNLYKKRRSFPLENLKQKSCIVATQVQQVLLEGAWSDKVLALPGCGPALSSSMEVVWVGPRARMGISEAIPSRVVPHTTSGRADYFGPLVNRYV